MAEEKEEYIDTALFPLYSPENVGVPQNVNKLHMTMLAGEELIPGSKMFYRALREEFNAKESDVWIITYPKTGTTWVTEVLLNIVAKGDREKVKEIKATMRTQGGFRPELLDYASNKNEDGSTPIDGAARVKEMNSGKEHRIFGTHIRERDVPTAVVETSKVIVVMRNPKDTCVSFYHFHRMNRKLGQFTGTFSQFLDYFIHGKVMFGDWFQYTKDFWNKHHHRSNFLFLKYEDMKKDFPTALKQISDFVGMVLREKEKLEVMENTTFKQMDKEMTSLFSARPQLNQNISKFLRKGEVGDWKNHFTVAESEAFDKIYDQRMEDFDVKFDSE